MSTQSKPSVTIRKVRPEEVGVKIPGISWIGLNGCAGKGSHEIPSVFQLWAANYAHAHVCDNDPDRGMMCTNENWLFNPDGTYSEIVLHETAHIITDYPIRTITCGQNMETHRFMVSTTLSVINLNNFAHEYPVWKDWAIRLGTTPTASLTLAQMFKMLGLDGLDKVRPA